MFIGIDLGTSGIKAIVLNSAGDILASETVSLTVSKPKPLWSEQNPEDWWNATCEAMCGLGRQIDLSNIEAIGLAGQMHGAVLLDNKGDVLRPAILWNDGRSTEECREIEEMIPCSREITGNMMMPGFTAPKLLWVKKNEPEIFEQVDKVLLPKDYIRYKMTGDFACDMSDAAGTMWLDVGRRDWNDELLESTGLDLSNMPTLFEGTQVTGSVLPEIAKIWGMPCAPVVAGAGDNAAGAIGVGVIKPGQAMLSLGTSGVYFAVSDKFMSAPDNALHSFCHAIPNVWHTMSVTLSAASCLAWFAKQHDTSVAEIIGEAQSLDKETSIIFLPYLSGERTPHNDPIIKGVFYGMTEKTSRAELAKAVLEGVSFALADGLDTLHEASDVPNEIMLIGGGARSVYWRQMLANVTGVTLNYRDGGDIGPALGAARLAQIGVNKDCSVEDVCPLPALVETYTPDEERYAQYLMKRASFKELYLRLKGFKG